MSKKTLAEYFSSFDQEDRPTIGLGIVQESTLRFNINSRDTRGETFLFKATQKGWTNVVEALLKINANPQIPDNTGNTPLHKAASMLSIPLVKSLVTSRVTVDAHNENGLTALWNTVVACFNSPQFKEAAFQIIELLQHANFEVQLPKKIQINNVVLSSTNMIPYFYACIAISSIDPIVGIEIAKKLLDTKPINPHIKDSSGWGYMHWLLSTSNPIEMLEKVYAQGGNVNDQDIRGDTCLHWLQHLNGELIEWFTSHGANLNITNNLGLTPLSRAYSSIALNTNSQNIAFLTEISKALLSCGIKYDTIDLSLKNFEIAFELKLLKEFLDKIQTNQAINTPKENSSTYLHLAAEKYGKPLVDKLIAMKANVSARDSEGYTPLHRAAARDDVKTCEVVETLILKNAEVHAIANDATTTPLSLACKSQNSSLVELLLNAIPLSSIPCQTLTTELVDNFKGLNITSTIAQEFLLMINDSNMLGNLSDQADLYS